MNVAVVDAIARALLYEGYVLYPYRASSVKNRQRWTFGCLAAPGWSRATSEACSMQTEVLVQGDARTLFEARVRFLHLVARNHIACNDADAYAIGDWQEAVEREVGLTEDTLGSLEARERVSSFVLEGGLLEGGLLEGGSETAKNAGDRITRRQETIAGEVRVSATLVGERVYRVRVVIENVTAFEFAKNARAAEAQLHALISTHTLLGVKGGELVSLLDPPDALADAAAACTNIGTWPVLVGDEGDRGTMISSPVILYDYPRVAPESPGDLFDGTEIDEILTLRILTLTDDEKRAMRAVDPRARDLLDRTEALSQADMMRLHGAMRSLGNGVPNVSRGLKPGDQVRLRPRARADVFDIALDGMVATIASIECDYEGRVFFAVTIDDDPGRDLGLLGKPGHRFFFNATEVDPL